MSTVVWKIYNPSGGASTDITNSVIFSSVSVSLQMNAVPGQFSLTVRDPNRTLSFSTGWEISLDVDGSRLFGGYITQVSMIQLAPAADTTSLTNYQLRAWKLTGSDYNIIFDRRIIRNTSNYLVSLPQFAAASNWDGDLLKSLLTNYTDTSDFTHTNINNLVHLPGDTVGNAAYKQQGTKLRDQFQQWSLFAGSVWYVDASKDFHWQTYDSVDKSWGFSDAPNYNPISSNTPFSGSTWGFSSVEASEDGSYIENDVLVWGGGLFAGAGGTVFSRAQDSTSESTHNRWQYAETHFGESLYSTQGGVDAQSAAFLNGPPGADALGQTKGLKFPQFQYTFTWFSDRVPSLSGVPDHIVPGDLVTIELNTFGVTKQLPLRTLNITFPTPTLVQFQGTFGLQLSDPFTLWRYLLSNQPRNQQIAAQTSVVTATSPSTVYGASFSGAPTPTPNGSATVFTLPFGYIAGTLKVFLNGLQQALGTSFTETDPVAGTFTMSPAPLATDELWCQCLTLAS